jgi:predicted MPP superfamily phosphohydrolase
VGGTAYTTVIEPHWIGISHLHVKLLGLPRPLEGVTVAQLTDLHRSTLVSRSYLERCVRQASALKPDLIVFTGDYLTHGRSERASSVYADDDPAELVRDCATCMAQAKARYGVFASLGNHDHWYDAAAVTRAIESAGIPVLRNKGTTVKINGAPLPVVGLGDLWTEGVNQPAAFAGVETPAIVLMHNPDGFENWSQPGNHLILAGHTHGGQVNLPLVGAPVVPSLYGQKYVQGLFRRGDTTMYVNRGIGVIWPGVRFNCPPEIAVFHLHSA